jgi:inosine-uridine nucleoside N-ribohydrolase
MALPLIFDTDPGVDDAIAIWLALAAREVDVLGLSVVFGNGHAAPCAENAVRILDAAGRSSIPVHVGADQPLKRSYARTGWGVHGVDGLGGIGLPAASRKADGQDAVAWMATTLGKVAPASITLAPIGPLTNIARLLQDHPDARRGIKEMIVMGGAAAPNGGNATPHAEYNFWLDPHAADIVCASGVPMTLVTIETARPVSATPARIARIEAAGTKVAKAVADLLRAYIYESKADALFDPLVVAYLLQPGFFKKSHAHFRVETGDNAELGRLIVAPSAAPTVHSLLQAPDPDTIFDFLAEHFGNLT